MEALCKIYALIDEAGLVRYIGKTVTPLKSRLSKHIKSALKSSPGKTHKNDWIKKMYRNESVIDIILIDSIPNDEWRFWETFYISLFKTWGYKLTNMTDGGDGHDNPWKNMDDAERKRRIDKLVTNNKSHKKRELMRKLRLGKTYIELFGVGKSEQLKEQKSILWKTNNPSKKGRINSDYNIECSKKANTKIYSITFPTGEVIKFVGRKQIHEYFKAEVNINNVYVSPYRVIRGENPDYKIKKE